MFIATNFVWKFKLFHLINTKVSQKCFAYLYTWQFYVKTTLRYVDVICTRNVSFSSHNWACLFSFENLWESLWEGIGLTLFGIRILYNNSRYIIGKSERYKFISKVRRKPHLRVVGLHEQINIKFAQFKYIAGK